MHANNTSSTPLHAVPFGLDYDLGNIEYEKITLDRTNQYKRASVAITEIIAKFITTAGIMIAVAFPLSASAYAVTSVEENFESISYIKNQDVPSFNDD